MKVNDVEKCYTSSSCEDAVKKLIPTAGNIMNAQVLKPHKVLEDN
jgi:hypothetical protein